MPQVMLLLLLLLYSAGCDVTVPVCCIVAGVDVHSSVKCKQPAFPAILIVYSCR